MMHKRLFVVVVALLAFTVFLSACGGGDDSSSSPAIELKVEVGPPEAKKPKTKLLPAPLSALPKINGQPYNREGFIWLSDIEGATPEAFIYTKQGWIYTPGAVRFSNASKGLRVKLGPDEKIVGAKFVYDRYYEAGSVDRKPSWNGKDPVPWGKRFITKSGKQGWEELYEVYVWIYDPHLLGSNKAANSAN